MKRRKPLISVGMPVYNGKDFLEEAIVSILSQTYTNFELIIGDDCSTDNSAQIYEKYAAKDKRIRIIKHKKNIGSIPNFNFVLNEAKGEYFIWAAQDDIRDSNSFEKLLELFEKYPDAVLAVSNYKNKCKEKTYFVYPKYPYNNEATTSESTIAFLKTNNLSFFYGLHKTNNLKKVKGYHEDSRPFFRSSDYLTIYKVLLNGKMVYRPEVLFFKRDTGLYTEQFERIKKLDYSQAVRKKIIRYLCFPLFYVYDLLYGTWFTIVSKLSVSDKIKVVIWLFINFVQRLIGYVTNIIKGGIAISSGLLHKSK